MNYAQEQTRLGRAVDAFRPLLDEYRWKEQVLFWEAISAEFALNASRQQAAGSRDAVVCVGKASADTIFSRCEMPVLRSARAKLTFIAI